MKYLCLIAITVLCGCQSSKYGALEEVCEANGLFKLKECQEISYTFNAHLGDKKIKRSWVWNIAEDKIFEDGKEVGRSPKFINDVYWLVFPLMVYDSASQTEMTVNENVKNPITGDMSRELIVKYVSGLGKTPDDTYKLYLNSDNMITAWTYHKAGQEKPNRATQWIDYKDFNGIKISLNRPGGEDFKIFFTDVSVK